MAHEPHVFGRWLTQALKGSAELMAVVNDVCRNRAAQGTQLPYVIWETPGSGDDDTTAGGYIHARFTVLVKVVSDDEDPKADPEEAARLLNVLLRDQRGVEFENYRITLLPQGAVGFPETFDGLRHLQHEGRYWEVVMTRIAGESS